MAPLPPPAIHRESRPALPQVMYSAYPPSKSMPMILRLTHIAKAPRWHVRTRNNVRHPAYADALTFLPFRDVAADRIDASRDFMTRHTRILKPGPQTLFDDHIAVANAARLHLDAH
jgi:hypothetical protein